jgi:hypothetical protein
MVVVVVLTLVLTLTITKGEMMFSVKEERVIKNPPRIEELRMTYRKKVLLVPGSSFLWSRLMRLRTKFWFLEDECDDGRVLFERLVGIAPRRYTTFFARPPQYQLVSLDVMPKRERRPAVLEWTSLEDENQSFQTEWSYLGPRLEKMNSIGIATAPEGEAK